MNMENSQPAPIDFTPTTNKTWFNYYGGDIIKTTYNPSQMQFTSKSIPYNKPKVGNIGC